MSRPIARRLKGEIAPGYRLRRPLKAKLFRHAGVWLATRREPVPTHNWGATREQAMAELGSVIVELYDDYEEHGIARLGPHLQRELHWLRRHLIREGG